MHSLFLQTISLLTDIDLKSTWAPSLFMWAAVWQGFSTLWSCSWPFEPKERIGRSFHPADEALSIWSRDSLGKEGEATLGTWVQWLDAKQLVRGWAVPQKQGWGETSSNTGIKSRLTNQSKDHFWSGVWMPYIWEREHCRVGGTE